MQAHHRKQRKKEAERNKKQRIKARDDRVVETKTVASIREEIKKLKHRKNLQSGEKQKLERLEKELKLVKEAAPQKANNSLFAKQQQQQQRQQKASTELDDPRKSVYYDERMNPYGAPPPGKPRLYHQRGGGVTMDIRLAIVPGLEPPPPPPRRPPPPPPPRPTNNNKQQRESSPPRKSEISKDRTPSPPPLPPSPHEKEEQTAEEESTKPLTIPSLPAPSKAVQRSRRHGKAAAADIWASTEEVEYERHANKVDLEADDVGAAAPKPTKKKKKKKPPLEFFYQDMSGSVQGPFVKTQMREWMLAGFFPSTILVRTNRNEKWEPITNVQALQQQEPPPSQQPKKENSVQDRIAALKQQEDSVQDRIAALKQVNNIPSKDDSVDEEEPSTSVQDRINALKGSSTGNKESKAVEQGPSQDPSNEELLPPPYHSENDSPPEEPTEEVVGPEPYPIDDDVGPGPEVAPYPVDDEYPAAAPYPVDDDEYPAAAPYPVDDDEYPAAAPYPVDDEYPASAPYPVDDEYPEDLNYPAAEPHPATGAYPETASTRPYEIQHEPPKKTIKVDSAVVAFLPTNVQKRKLQPTQSPTQVPQVKKKKVVESKEDPNDDYEKFMKEMEGIE